MRTDVQAFISSIDVSGFPAPLTLTFDGTSSVNVSLQTACCETGAPYPLTIKLSWVVLSTMTPAEVARVMRDVFVQLLVHELDEQFLVSGVRLFDPHAADSKLSWNSILKVKNLNRAKMKSR